MAQSIFCLAGNSRDWKKNTLLWEYCMQIRWGTIQFDEITYYADHYYWAWSKQTVRISMSQAETTASIWLLSSSSSCSSSCWSSSGEKVKQGALYSQLWDRDLWLSLRVDHTLSSRTPPSTPYITARLPAYVNDLFQVTASCNTAVCAYTVCFHSSITL